MYCACTVSQQGNMVALWRAHPPSWWRAMLRTMEIIWLQAADDLLSASKRGSPFQSTCQNLASSVVDICPAKWIRHESIILKSCTRKNRKQITEVSYNYVIEETGNEDYNIAALAHDPIYRAQCSHLWLILYAKRGRVHEIQRLQTEKLHFVHNLPLAG